MKTLQVALIAVALLAPATHNASGRSDSCGEPEPQLAMPRPPRSVMRFEGRNGADRETLEVRYLGPGKLSFTFDKTGACQIRERGTALIQPCWWLGVETDENEAGEAVAVQQYTFTKNSQCTIEVRIDEGGWSQATVLVAPGCGRCPSFDKILHPSGGRHGATHPSARHR